MEEDYVWNIAEVVKSNPIPDEKKLTRTLLVGSKYCSALVVQVQPQTEPFKLVHKEHDELIYLLEGEGLAYIGDKKFEVKAGDLLYVPAGVEHGFFMKVKGIRLAIYAPPFDLAHPDRVIPSGKDLA